MPIKVLILSIVPAPYQRDLFAAMNDRDDLDIQVRYAEGGSPDSPWPKRQLNDYESIYRSFYLSWGGKRFIVNWQLPSTKGFDAVVVNGYVTIPAQVVLRTAFKRMPVIFWAEKLEHAQGGIREFVQRILTRPMMNLSAIVAIGKSAARDYRAVFPEIPVFELPYYCSLESFKEDVADSPGRPVTILFCGQMIERKGVDLLLEAFSNIIDEKLEARLLLVGREAELTKMMENISPAVAEFIEYAGFQSPEDLPEFFRRSDVFVLPSRYDGWGVVVNQALGAGLPIVCSDAVGSAEDLVSNNENGFVFENGNVAELTNILIRLISSSSMIRRLAEDSLKRSKEITPEKGAEAWASIIKSLVEK